MKMSRDEQVFKSFVQGDKAHTVSPLLRLSEGVLYQSERATMRKKLGHCRHVAINMEGTIIHPPLHQGCSQVLGMLNQVRAKEVDDESFKIILWAFLNYLGSFPRLACVLRSSEFSTLKSFRDCLTRYDIENPYGDSVENVLRFINRRYCENAYHVALTGVTKKYKPNSIFAIPPYPDDILTIAQFTVFKDETEAMLLRLSDTSNNMEFINLQPA